MNEGFQNYLLPEFEVSLRPIALISSHVFKIVWEIFLKMWEISQKKSVVLG